MRFDEDVKESASLLKRVIAEISKTRGTANPYNYGLWYAALAESNSQLQKELQRAVAEGRDLDADFMVSLYKKYVINDIVANNEKMEKAYKTVLAKIMARADETRNSTAELKEELEQVLTDVYDTEDIEEIRGMLGGVTEKAQLLNEDAGSFHKELTEAREEISRLNEELSRAKDEANKDALTGLYNRRFFDSKIANVIHSLEDNKELAVLMVDVDHFKSFNDTYGHLTGDVVLKGLAKVMCSICTEPTMIPCRFGGEEFAILYYNASRRRAMRLGEDLRQSIARLKLRHAESKERIKGVTASIGIATTKGGESISDIVERADKALYFAKELGRNQVMTG